MQARQVCGIFELQFFEASKFNVPHLFHIDSSFDPQLHHSWSEFDGVEETPDSPTDERSIGDFIRDLNTNI